ncbi:DUF72 domain-containing protein [Pararobbsia silviterrae]|uniref:DUF72 domain-containing protein n=1 Tax=Pararobbsia silviterrae TaxID=1792498 RepID=A0A494Y4U9_9BURK|nr:DUF72 domain-containing protein [Pararobbsia silviterrae]RKP56533.1 DUF72 domain-containing protein [Pararobbsia silviterrae]
MTSMSASTGHDAQFDLFGEADDGSDPLGARDPHAGPTHAPARTRGARVHRPEGTPDAKVPATLSAGSAASTASQASLDGLGLDDTAAPLAAPGTPRQAASRGRALPVMPASVDDSVALLGDALPQGIRLGTSTWSFPGWKGIVYRDEVSSAKLSRDGLHAYGRHPVLGCVGIDRSFYSPLTVAQYARYAAQVPEDFRFVVKAPASVCDATIRGPRGGVVGMNMAFLNADIARDDFVLPCLDGLGHKAGALVFQLSPMTPELLAEPAALIDRLGAFFAALPALDAREGAPVYAIEIRDPVLLTPRFIRMLRETRVRYCIGVHARMPDILRQAAALALLDDDVPGPLIVRWSLHAGFEYETAKAKYAPFDAIVDADPTTRAALAELAARYALAGQSVLITVNNKAEGSAPLSCIDLASTILAILDGEREDTDAQTAEAHPLDH